LEQPLAHSGRQDGARAPLTRIRKPLGQCLVRPAYPKGCYPRAAGTPTPKTSLGEQPSNRLSVVVAPTGSAVSGG